VDDRSAEKKAEKTYGGKEGQGRGMRRTMEKIHKITLFDQSRTERNSQCRFRARRVSIDDLPAVTEKKQRGSEKRFGSISERDLITRATGKPPPLGGETA